MPKKILFNKPFITNQEISNIKKIFLKKYNLNFGYQGYFSKLCTQEIKKISKAKEVLLTSSCTGALEIITKAIDIKKGDEIIIPSFTFVSAVDAFVNAGAKIVFCNIDENFIIDLEDLKKKINKKTKAVVLVHYNGNSVDFEKLNIFLKRKKKICVIEDAAAVLGSKYKNKYLGTLGDFGCYSFHESKNIHCGVGGALLINNKKYLKKSKIIWNRGTNREDFDKKKINKYQWVDNGKSYHLSEIQAAFLLSQLKFLEKNLRIKKKIFFSYYTQLKDHDKFFKLPSFNQFNKSNYHIFFIVVKSKSIRQSFLNYMNKNLIQTVIHYEPLHSSNVGRKLYKKKDLKKTYDLSKRIIRFPSYVGLTEKEIKRAVNLTLKFFKID